ncbi:MAG TPA: multidrug ABC transporter [Erysipelotrichaceae bacterium]|nr:multidrug ABC transporter [Erysipelotrichaceae bacterium]
MNSFSYIIVYVLSVLIASFSQILLKLSANEKHGSQIQEYFNFKVILAYTLFTTSLFLTIIAFKKIPLSFGPIIESLGTVFILFLSNLILKEKFNSKKLFGVALILFGIILTTL